LLEALKNAANIRGLKPEDSVTVSVTGLAQARPKMVSVKNGSIETTRLIAPPPGSGARSATMMTIRVKKSDVDALAKGSLNFDEFRKRARITTYIGGANPEGESAGFGGGGF
jgi:hypothetical protein